MHDQRLVTSARRALVGCFVCVLSASVVLVTAILRHDFRFESVAEHSSREVPRAVPDLVVLVEPGGLAAALAARAQRPLGLVTYQHRRRVARAACRTSWRSSAARARSSRSRRASSRARSRRSPRCRATAPASCRRCRTRTCSPTRRCSTSATWASRSRSRSRCRRSSAGRTDGRWLQAVRRWTLVPVALARPSACCSARSGPTRRSAGAASGAGIPSRTPR